VHFSALFILRISDVNILGKVYSTGVRFLRQILFLGPHTCPWWFGYSFDNPVRRFIHNPITVLEGFVKPGASVIDIGCGLGYFSIALARLVGPGGRVIALDVQPQMVKRARHRATRHGLADRIDFHTCAADHLGITQPADFILAFWVVHEVADPQALFQELRSLLKPEGYLLIAEPKGHVSATRFAAIVALAREVGFQVTEGPPVRFSRSILCAL